MTGREVFGLVQETVAKLERAAVQMGFYGKSKSLCRGIVQKCFLLRSRGLPGTFGTEGECRNPERARPSMSGFGINVRELLGKSRGFLRTTPICTIRRSDRKEPMTWVAGLVMLG